MAEGKDIPIRITATGGDQAAAEVRKVSAAVEAASGGGGETRGFGGMLDGVPERAEEAAEALGKVGNALDDKGGDGIATKVKSATQGLREMADQTPRVERGTRNMGAAVLSFSQGLEDAQYGIRGVVNNIPGLVTQLGGGLGLAGVVSIAAVSLSVLGPKIAEMLGAADDTAGLDEVNEKLAELRKRSDELSAARSQLAQTNWLNALDDEEAAIREQNTLISENLRLIKERLDANLDVATARNSAEKAEIDADPNKTDAQKIREKAAKDQELSNLQLQSASAADAVKVEAAAQAARQAKELADRKAADEAEARRKVEREAAEAASLRGRIIAADQAKGRLPGLDEKIAASSTPVGFIPGGGNLSQKLEAQRQQELAALEEERAKAGLAAGGVTAKDRQRFSELVGDDGKGETTGRLGRLRASAAELTQEFEQLKEAAANAAIRAASERESANISATRRGGVFSERSRELAVTTDERAKEAERRAADARAKEAERARAEELRNKLEATEGTLDAKARASGPKIGRTGERLGGRSGDSLEKIGERLSDGTTEAEIEKLAQQFQKATQGMGGATIAAIREMLAEQQRLAKEISNLRGQIKGLRTGK